MSDLQLSVPLKLGGCMLQLQKYERLLNAMVAQSELSGPSERLRLFETRRSSMPIIKF
ncbi:hypothetical protein ALP12_200291 [Pseudomonas savastanoi pv. phaseolicola]|nr:hypothetical protein ALP12_200291 [Pseudomonas savastanoi pv. phaseolicola]